LEAHPSSRYNGTRIAQEEDNMQDEKRVQQIREAWARSYDVDILKAIEQAAKEPEAYPPTVRRIIMDEAIKRQLIMVDDSGELTTDTPKRQAIQEKTEDDIHKRKWRRREIALFIFVVCVVQWAGDLMDLGAGGRILLFSVGGGCYGLIWVVLEPRRKRGGLGRDNASRRSKEDSTGQTEHSHPTP
jgi:hypothetical protein